MMTKISSFFPTWEDMGSVPGSGLMMPSFNNCWCSGDDLIDLVTAIQLEDLDCVLALAQPGPLGI